MVLDPIFVKVPMQINQLNLHKRRRRPGTTTNRRLGRDDRLTKLGQDWRVLEKKTVMVQLSGSVQCFLEEEQVGSEAGQGESQKLRFFCCEMCPFVTAMEQNLADHRQARHPNVE